MAQSTQPPHARVEKIYHTYFGTTIEDPYQWMEPWKSDEVQTWMAAQADYSRAYFDALPTHRALLERVSELSATDPLISNIQIVRDKVFYLLRSVKDTVPRLVVRSQTGGQERTLIDPHKSHGQENEAHRFIEWYTPSNDGRYVAYSLSKGGSEDGTLYVFDIEQAQLLSIAISRVLPLKLSRANFAGVSWRPDNRSFLYHRLAELSEQSSETDRYNNSHTFLHRLGNDPEQDSAILGIGVNEHVPLAPEDFPLVTLPQNGKWAIATIIHGSQKERTLYIAPAGALEQPSTCNWKRICDVDSGVVAWCIDDEYIYLLTHQGTPRYRVISVPLEEPELIHASEVLAEGPATIEDIRVVGNYLVSRELDAGIARMRRVRLTSGRAADRAEQIRLPFDGTILEWICQPASPQLLFLLVGWTMSPQIYLYKTDAGILENTNWYPPSVVDFSEIEAYEVIAPSWDGTPVPLSIIHKKGLVLNGKNPTLLTGYGAYGISLKPNFIPAMLAWYEQGGIWATAHIRGGGELGETWYQAGRKMNKENTIRDFICCAEYLIKQGYTRSELLAGEGTSAGGISSGGALVRRPDLWAVMVMRVPVTNTLRIETTENGPPNIPEYGSVTTEEGFKALLLADAYTHIQENVAYPAVLLTTGLNDPRVVPWQPYKMAARLQAATISNRPVLLRVERQGGHGVGATKDQLDLELADKLAFLLEQFHIHSIQ